MSHRATPTLAHDQVQAVIAGLSQAWVSIPQLSTQIGLTTRAVRWAVKETSQQQVIFCRHGDPAWTAKQYRIYPEAKVVRVSGRRDEEFCAPENKGQRHVLPYRVHRLR